MSKVFLLARFNVAVQSRFFGPRPRRKRDLSLDLDPTWPYSTGLHAPPSFEDKGALPPGAPLPHILTQTDLGGISRLGTDLVKHALSLAKEITTASVSSKMKTATRSSGSSASTKLSPVARQELDDFYRLIIVQVLSIFAIFVVNFGIM